MAETAVLGKRPASSDASEQPPAKVARTEEGELEEGELPPFIVNALSDDTRKRTSLEAVLVEYFGKRQATIMNTDFKAGKLEELPEPPTPSELRDFLRQTPYIMLHVQEEEFPRVFMMDYAYFCEKVAPIAAKFAPEEKDMVNYLRSARCVGSPDDVDDEDVFLSPLDEKRGLTKDKIREGNAIAALLEKFDGNADGRVSVFHNENLDGQFFTNVKYVVYITAFE